MIENKSQERTKIHLDAQDLRLLGFGFCRANHKNILSKNLLRTLLATVNFNKKLKIESYSIKNHELNIYFSPLKTLENFSRKQNLNAKNYIYKFENVDNLLSALNAINLKVPENLTADLYLLNENYKLVLHTESCTQNCLLTALKEYSELQNFSIHTVAHLRESGKTLLENKSLKEFTALFG